MYVLHTFISPYLITYIDRSNTCHNAQGLLLKPQEESFFAIGLLSSIPHCDKILLRNVSPMRQATRLAGWLSIMHRIGLQRQNKPRRVRHINNNRVLGMLTLPLR